MEQTTKRKKAIFILFTVGVAVLAGVVGSWAYNYWFGQITILSDQANRDISTVDSQMTNALLNHSRQVVVAQDDQSMQVIEGTEKVVVGIFKKRADNNYELLTPVTTGVLITSDGWLAANWETKDGAVKPDDYVMITKDKKIFNLDKITFDSFSSLTFAHARAANSLPVIGFSPSLDLKRGQEVFLVGWLKTVKPAVLIENRRRDDILSSDQSLKPLTLSVTDITGLVAVDLSGRVVGWVTKDKQVVSVDYIITSINYLLANQKTTRTVFGVNYLNAEYHIKNNQPVGAVITKDKKGVAVVPNSPAAKAGLKEGDIIYSVDDKEIAYGTDLADVIATYQSGQKLNVKYWRGTEKKEAIVTITN